MAPTEKEHEHGPPSWYEELREPIRLRACEIALSLPMKKPGLVFPSPPSVERIPYAFHSLPREVRRHKDAYQALVQEYPLITKGILREECVLHVLDGKHISGSIMRRLKKLFHPDTASTASPPESLDPSATQALRHIYQCVSQDLTEVDEKGRPFVKEMLEAISEGCKALSRREVVKDFSDPAFQAAVQEYIRRERNWNQSEVWEVAVKQASQEEREGKLAQPGGNGKRYDYIL